MKNILLASIIILLSACTTLETINDYISENDMLTSIAARQAVGRYIAAGDTLEAETRRAESVVDILNKVNSFIDGNPKASPGDILKVVESNIKWDKLETSDRMLVSDILFLLNKELETKDEAPKLIAIRALFDTAISAARVYLLR